MEGKIYVYLTVESFLGVLSDPETALGFLGLE